MSDLYWLTVLGNIKVATTVFLILSSIILAIGVIGMIVSLCEDEEENCNITKKVVKVTIPIFVISLLVEIFIPFTKELYFIYGVGSTIDYLKSNPTAKQLPDKYIKVLDKWSDELLMDKEKE